MAQKVATAHKMKPRQETTSLGQIATVTAKPTRSDKHFINTDTRRFKIQTGDVGPPPPPPWQGLYIQVRVVHAYGIVLILHIVAQLLIDPIKLKGL